MAIRKGVEVICSRCGNKVFLEDSGQLIFGVGNAAGWVTLGVNHHLCPQCAIPFKRFMTWFFDEKQCPANWRFKKGEDV